MKIFYVAAVVASLTLLAGCGGGDGGGTVSSGGSSSSSSSSPSLTVTLSATSGSATVVDYAAATSATVTATGVASGTITTPVVADLSYDKTLFASVTATPGTAANSYTVTATTLPNLTVGSYASPITFRLCQEAACTHVYAGSNVTYTYNLTVNLGEWTTFQRTASHQGYLPVTLDTSKFIKLWTWKSVNSGYINGVVAGNGSVFLSSGQVYSLNETTGTQNWSYDIHALTSNDSAGPPAYDNGTVYVPFLLINGALNNSRIRSFDATTGAVKADSTLSSQSSNFNSPVIYQGELFYSQGYDGGQSYKYNLPSGTTAWASTVIQSNTSEKETPAVDQNYVYYSTGYGLAVYKKSDGSLVSNTSETRQIIGEFNGLTAPILTAAGHVLIRNAQSTNNMEAVDPVTKTFVWRTGDGYQDLYQPAVAGNVIYTVYTTAVGSSIQALSDTDGSVLWSWALPGPDIHFLENIVVCDNLLFVSSDRTVYAIDLKTHLPVWSYAAHGKLSISSNYILYVVANDYGIGGSLTAIKLK